MLDVRRRVPGAIMTAELATRPGLPGTLREDGYDLPPDLAFERWLEVGQTLQAMERSVKWWLGDWWNYGCRRYGEMVSQAAKDHVEDSTGYAYHTIENAGAVARKFENSRRRDNLSWSHHDAVAVLPPVEADAMLDQAAEDGLNVFALRDAVRERKRALAGGAVTADGASLDTEPLTWQPAISDLTAEARAALEANAPGGRHRLGYEQGFLRGLVYAGARDCFTDWREG
jgi:hypothetical protein